MGVLGSTRNLNQKQIARIVKLHRDGLNFATIARRVDCTARTVSRVVKRETKETGADA
jgi:IS30 family transposase